LCVVIQDCPRNQPCVCRQCRQDGDCPPQRPRCNTGTDSITGKLCNECLEDAHCPAGQLCDQVPGKCEGFECDSNEDCEDGLICRQGSCVTDPCVNGIEDGDESDVDCGGSCPKCNRGARCRDGSDCRSRTCEGGICAETCTNGILDNAEMDIDCGGPNCPKCADGKSCRPLGGNGNCESGICGVGNVCTPVECGPAGHCCSGVKDGDESDVDCGGEFCPKCQVGQGCRRNAHCETFRCGTGPDGFSVCFPPE
jgi:hypothetical protein